MIFRQYLAPLLLLCLVQGSNDPPAKRHRSIRVPVRIPASEAGPLNCPQALRAVLQDLEAPSAKVRMQARVRLCKLNWRHLSWMRKEQTLGGAERRLALRFVTRTLEDRRLAGEAALPLEAGLRR